MADDIDNSNLSGFGKFRRSISSWIYPNSNPDIESKFQASLPLKIDDQFAKSKRNLLWLGTVSILLWLSTGFGASTACVQLGFVIGPKIIPWHLSILLLAYGIYLFVNYRYELGRVLALNSDFAIASASNEAFHLIKDLHAKLVDIENEFRTVSSPSGAVNLVSAIEQRALDKQFEKTQDKLVSLDHKLHETRQLLTESDTYFSQWQNSKSHDASDEFIEAYKKVSASITGSSEGSGIDPHGIEQEIRLLKSELVAGANALDSFNQYSDKLDLGLEKLKMISESVEGLSGRIRSSDQKKFRYIDTWVPNMMSAFALASLLSIFCFGITHGMQSNCSG